MTSSGTGAYTIANRDDAIDFMADYPEYGEQRWYTSAIAAEGVSFSWRRMLPGTGGRDSYGHCHPGQEVPLGPQRHRRRGGAADLLAPPRRAPDREAR